MASKKLPEDRQEFDPAELHATSREFREAVNYRTGAIDEDGVVGWNMRQEVGSVRKALEQSIEETNSSFSLKDEWWCAAKIPKIYMIHIKDVLEKKGIIEHVTVESMDYWAYVKEIAKELGFAAPPPKQTAWTGI